MLPTEPALLTTSTNYLLMGFALFLLVDNFDEVAKKLERCFAVVLGRTGALLTLASNMWRRLSAAAEMARSSGRSSRSSVSNFVRNLDVALSCWLGATQDLKLHLFPAVAVVLRRFECN